MAKIEIDGKVVETQLGRTIIEVADEIGVEIPRFCYHKKLSVAANCRMCLVEVSGSKKTLPACATPIADGMKIATRSEEAVRSQKAVMEFLLINHPLDCPICDQGGECELQDVSMGYGVDHSEYKENKRSVADENLGALIATEMTRCIHCTRCVRFGTEIAGFRELGATGRGENTKIGTFIEHSMSSEISGNVIDLCPVGALTSKPYRFTARAWELMQSPSLSPHDCLNSNTFVHFRRDEIMRVVPRENESINQTWLSDRDRFAYTGLNHPDRATQPMIKKQGQWHTVTWDTALEFTVAGLQDVLKKHGPEALAAFASPSSTLEEFYLLQKLMRSMGVKNIDYRMQQLDFRDDNYLNITKKPKINITDLENQKQIFIVGCQIEREVPLTAVRLRAAVAKGAKLLHLDSFDTAQALNFDHQLIVNPQEICFEIAKIIIACNKELNIKLKPLLLGLTAEAEHEKLAAELQKPDSVIIVGELIRNHPDASTIRALLRELSKITHAKILELSAGGNSEGAKLAGMLPHEGLNVSKSIAAKLASYVLLNVEADFDFANSALSREAMMSAEFVVAISPYVTEGLKNDADVILPAAAYTESSGTYVNIDHIWQTINGIVKPKAEARPIWKILRVLGNHFNIKGFDYNSTEEVRNELVNYINNNVPDDFSHSEEYWPTELKVANEALTRVSVMPIYRVDLITRHSKPLQNCASRDRPLLHINPETAKKYNVTEKATVSQGLMEVTIPVVLNAKIAKDVVLLMHGLQETMDLGSTYGEIKIC
jgi:NADH-quinone oxidoreductase subunit G